MALAFAASLTLAACGSTNSAPGGGFAPVIGGSGEPKASEPHTPFPTPVSKNSVAFYAPLADYFSDGGHALSTVASILASEGYEPPDEFFDPTFGTDDPGNATFANFKTLKNYGIVLISTHGSPNSLGVEFYCKAEIALQRYAQLAATYGSQYLSVSTQAGDSKLCGSKEPTDLEHFVRNQYASLPPEVRNSITLPPIGELPPAGAPVVWSVDVTREGMQHFFSGHHVSLLFLTACNAYPMGADLEVPAYFGYGEEAVAQSTPGSVFGGGFGGTCTGTAAQDLTTLFSSLAGEYDIKYRSTDAAYAHWKGRWSAQLQYKQYGAPVLLSPAVLSTDPADGGSLTPGQTRTVTVNFDTAMDQGSEPVTAEGCGAKVTDQKWVSPTDLQVTVKVPEGAPSGSKVTMTVNKDKARAGKPGWNNTLDGNQDPSPQNGEDPNDSDYVWHLNCGARGLGIFLSGTDGAFTLKGEIGGPGAYMRCDGFGNGHFNVFANGDLPDGTHVSLEMDGGPGVDTFGVPATLQNNALMTLNLPGRLHAAGAGEQAGSGTISVTGTGAGSVNATLDDGVKVTGSWTCP